MRSAEMNIVKSGMKYTTGLRDAPLYLNSRYHLKLIPTNITTKISTKNSGPRREVDKISVLNSTLGVALRVCYDSIHCTLLNDRVCDGLAQLTGLFNVAKMFPSCMGEESFHLISLTLEKRKGHLYSLSQLLWARIT